MYTRLIHSSTKMYVNAIDSVLIQLENLHNDLDNLDYEKIVLS